MDLSTALRLGEQPRPAVITVVGGGGKTSLLFRLADELVARGQRVVTATTTRVAVHQLGRAPALLRLPGGRLQPEQWAALEQALAAHGHCFVVGSETLLNGKQAGVAAEVVDALAQQGAALGLDAIVVEGDGSRTLPAKAPAAHEPVIPACTTLVLSTLGLDAIGAPLDAEHVHRPEQVRALLGLPAAGDERLTPAHAAALLVHPAGGAKDLPPGAQLVAVLNKADVPAHLAPGRLIAAQLAHAGRSALLAAAGNPAQPAVLERWGAVAAVLLAAGASRRFGSPKQLALLDGQPLVERAARCALAAGVQQLIVVTGAAAPAVEQALAPLRREAGSRLQLVHNAEWSTGQSSSLRAALRTLLHEPGAPQALLCLPVDQPWLPPALLRRMLAAWRSGADLVAAQVEGEAGGALRGAPALFDRSLFGELALIEGDQGGRSLLQRHAQRVAAIPAQPGWLVDVDDPAGLHSAPAGDAPRLL